MAAPTYVTHVGFGHTVDEKAFVGSASGWTLVDSTPNYIETAGNVAATLITNKNFTPLTNVWMSCRLFHHEGQIATSADIALVRFRAAGSSDEIQVHIIQSTDNDHFVIELFEGSGVTSIGQGTKEIAVDTDFSLLIWQNGARVRCKTDGTEDDIDVAHTGKVNQTGIQLRPAGGDNLGAGDKLRWGPIAVHHSDAAADRPGVTVGDQVVYPDGNKEQGYGNLASCDPGQTGGAFGDVDDWASGTSDEATTLICENASEGDYFMATMTTVTVANSFTGCRFVIRNRASDTSKTANWDYTIRDNDGTPNEIRKAGPNLGSTGFSTRSMEFPLAPDGGAWSQGELDNLNAGVRSSGSNTANDEHTVFMIEVCTVDLDLPPAVDDRRRLLAA